MRRPWAPREAPGIRLGAKWNKRMWMRPVLASEVPLSPTGQTLQNARKRREAERPTAGLTAFRQTLSWCARENSAGMGKFVWRGRGRALLPPGGGIVWRCAKHRTDAACHQLGHDPRHDGRERRAHRSTEPHTHLDRLREDSDEQHLARCGAGDRRRQQRLLHAGIVWPEPRLHGIAEDVPGAEHPDLSRLTV